MRPVLFLLPLCLTACSLPVAQDKIEPEWSPAYVKCLKAAANVDPAVNACNDAELARQDAALNAAYAKALNALDAVAPKQKPRLIEAERRWIAWRDAECGWQRIGDGMLDRQMEMQCLIRLTRERAGGLNFSVLADGN